MDQADSQAVGFDLDFTKVFSDSSKDPWLTPSSKLPDIYVKPRHTFESFLTYLNLKPKWEPLYQEFAKYNKRYCSFDTWLKQLNPTPVGLSQAGFFYLGNNDTVMCFFCGIALHAWNFSENASVAQKEHSPDYAYLGMICSL